MKMKVSLLLIVSLSLSQLEDPVTQEVVIAQIDNHAIRGWSLGTGFIGWCVIKAKESSVDLTMTKDGEVCQFSLNVKTLSNTVEQCEMVATRVHNPFLNRFQEEKDFVFVKVSSATAGIECRIASGDVLILQWSLREQSLLGGCHDLRSLSACATNADCAWNGQVCLRTVGATRSNSGLLGGCHDMLTSTQCSEFQGDYKCFWNGEVCSTEPQMGMFGGCHDLWNYSLCNDSDSCQWKEGTCKEIALGSQLLGGCHDMLNESMCITFMGGSCHWTGEVCQKQEEISMVGAIRGGCHDLWRQEMCAQSNECEWKDNSCTKASHKAEILGGCHDLWNQRLCSTSNSCEWRNQVCSPKANSAFIKENPLIIGGCHDLWQEQMCRQSNSCEWRNQVCSPKANSVFIKENPLIIGGCHDLWQEQMCRQSNSCEWRNQVCSPKANSVFIKENPMIIGGCHDLWQEQMCRQSTECEWRNQVCSPKANSAFIKENPMIIGGCHDLWNKSLCTGVQGCRWASGICQTLEAVNRGCNKHAKKLTCVVHKECQWMLNTIIINPGVCVSRSN